MVIVFDKKLGVRLIYFQIVYNLILCFLTSVLGLPHFLNYVTDIVTVLLFVTLRKKIFHMYVKSGYRSALCVIGLFWAIVSLTALFNLVPFLLYVWAVRNVFRFYVFFLACGTFLEAQDVDRIFEILYKFQYLNIVLCLYEHFVLGCEQDNLGGIFGTGSGCNGPLNLYLFILLTWAFSKYMAKKLALTKLLVILASSLCIGAVAELKVLFLEFVLIAGMVFFLFKPSIKHAFFIAAGAIALFIGLMTMRNVFEGAFNTLMDKEKLLKTAASSYVGGESFSRAGALQQISKNYFHNKISRVLFGYGFGACETSAYFQSDFYRLYGEIARYRWFGHAMLFLETGLVGLISYILFFIDTARYAFIRMKALAERKYHAVIVIVISTLSIAMTWYNLSLRTESAYLVFFVLAIVSVDVRSMREKERKI